MSTRVSLLALVFAIGCSGDEDKSDGTGASGDTSEPGTTADTDDTDTDTDDTDDSGDTGGTGPVDADGDGYTADVDCDDTNPDVHPGAVEVPGDGLDNDCDPSTCSGSGFSPTAVTLDLPEGYGARTFSAPGNPGDCEGERPRWSFVDVTGDQRDDIVMVRSPCGDVEPGLSSWTVHPAGDTAYGEAITWSLPPDLPEGALRAAVNPGGCAETSRPRWAIRDLTGDGLADLVITQDCADDSEVGTIRWRLFENTGSGFAAGTDFSLPSGYATGALDDFSSIPNCSAGRPGYSLIDTDADGDEDLVVTSSPCIDDDPGITHWTVHENTGSGFSDTTTAFTLPSYPAGTFVSPGHTGSCADGIPRWNALDVDGDGWLDAVVTWTSCDDTVVGTTEWWVHAGSATGFSTAPTTWTLPTGYGSMAFDAVAGDANCDDSRPRYLLQDMESDGRPELVVLRSPCEDDDVGEARWLVYRSSGTAFSDTPDDWTLPTGYGAATFHRESAVRECAPEVPGWTLEDANQDGYLDVFITASACLDDAVGDTVWAVHEGGCSL